MSMLKPRKPLRRSPFRRKEGPTAPKSERPQAPIQKLVCVPNYSGGLGAAVPKSEPKRNPHLLAMAQGRPCLLLVPGCCNHRLDTTVACHSNLSVHGKAGARKADDQYSVFGCAACHEWLDRSGAGLLLKTQTFMAAHLLQVLAWREIAADPSEPERFRKAAQWALEQLGATPAVALPSSAMEQEVRR